MITNFRDIGGKVGADNKKVEQQQLFRSGTLANLSKAEQDFLTQENQIQVIVDFRSEAEKKSDPDTVPKGVEYIAIDVLADSLDKNGSLANMMTADISAEEMMEAIYKNLVLLDSAHQGYQQFLNLLLDLKGQSLIFHCSAGKDRTGFGAALILRILGVSSEDIYQDYLLTNTQRVSENQQILSQVEETKQLSNEQIAQIKQMLEVKKTYLETAFSTIDKEYGDFKTYVNDVLNFSDEKIKQLRKLYLK